MKKFILLFTLLLCILSGCVENKPSENNIVLDGLATLHHGAGEVTFSQKGIYKIEHKKDKSNCIIKFIDTNNFEETALCNRAECLHNDDTCTAFIESGNPYICYLKKNDKLIVFSKIYENETLIDIIEIMDSNGENRKTLYKFKSSEMLSYPIKILTYDDSIALSICDMSENESNLYSIISIDYINFTSEILQKIEGYCEILGIQNNNIILKNEISFLNENKDIIYKTRILSSNIATKEVSTLYEPEDIILNETPYVNSYILKDAYLYEIAAENYLSINKIDLNNGTKNNIYENQNITSDFSFSLYGIYDNKIIIDYSQSQKSRIAIDLATGEYYALTLKISGEDKREAYIPILAETNDYYYVSVNSKIDEFNYLTYNGTYEVGKITLLERAFILKENYYINNPEYIFSSNI